MNVFDLKGSWEHRATVIQQDLERWTDIITDLNVAMHNGPPVEYADLLYTENPDAMEQLDHRVRRAMNEWHDALQRAFRVQNECLGLAERLARKLVESDPVAGQAGLARVAGILKREGLLRG